MRPETPDPRAAPLPDSDWEIDAEIFDGHWDDPWDGPALEAAETRLEDEEPWQRLGDIIGRITGEAETA